MKVNRSYIFFYPKPPKGRFSSILKKSSPAFNSLRDSTRTFDRISSPEGMKVSVINQFSLYEF